VRPAWRPSLQTARLGLQAGQRAVLRVGSGRLAGWRPQLARWCLERPAQAAQTAWLKAGRVGRLGIHPNCRLPCRPPPPLQCAATAPWPPALESPACAPPRPLGPPPLGRAAAGVCRPWRAPPCAARRPGGRSSSRRCGSAGGVHNRRGCVPPSVLPWSSLSLPWPPQRAPVQDRSPGSTGQRRAPARRCAAGGGAPATSWCTVIAGTGGAEDAATDGGGEAAAAADGVHVSAATKRKGKIAVQLKKS